MSRQPHWYTHHLIVLIVALILPTSAFAYEGQNFVIEDGVLDYGTGTSQFGTNGSFHGSGGQLRGNASDNDQSELMSGYLFYDDEAPVFPPQGSTDPDFTYWVQNISGTQATFHSHVMDDFLPDRSSPGNYQMRSGLNLGGLADGPIRMYYKASPGLDPDTDSRAGTWGYSESNGDWTVLGDDDALHSNWRPIQNLANTLQACIDGDIDGPYTSCVTDSDNSPNDGISFQGPDNGEVMMATVDFANHDISELQGLSGDSVVKFKAVDMAGNVAFSQPVSSIPWLKTERGDVHSNKKAIMFTPPPEGNVAHIITAADSIVNFESVAEREIENYPGPSFIETIPWTPIPYPALKARATALADNLDAFENAVFENKGIYLSPTDLTINAVSNDYQGIDDQGSATIVVEGNLYINGDFKLREGGYIAFLVRGDIVINGSVEEIRGTFLADHRIDENGITYGGLFDSGSDAGSPLQLRVVGQVIARSGFLLNRIYIGTGSFEPSELIIFDPQIILNTPPGIKAIPGLGAWEETRP